MYMCDCMSVYVLEGVGGVKVSVVANLSVKSYRRVCIQCIMSIPVRVYDIWGI